MLVSVCVCVCVCERERERERDVYGNYWVSITSSRKNQNEFLGQPNRIETEFRPVCFCPALVRISKVVACASTRRRVKSGCLPVMSSQPRVVPAYSAVSQPRGILSSPGTPDDVL